jgi:hypothetical protein
MDHFCPWMNNAIGAKNQKNFFLFLVYTDIVAVYAYIVLVIHLVGPNHFVKLNVVNNIFTDRLTATRTAVSNILVPV